MQRVFKAKNNFQKLIAAVIAFFLICILPIRMYAQPPNDNTTVWNEPNENMYFGADANENGYPNGSFRFGFGESNVYDANWEEVFTILRSGRVGIGTSAPTNALHVVGKGYFTDKIGIGISAPNAPLQIANHKSLQNRAIVVYEESNNHHEFHGFGVNGGIFRYQVTGTGADHVFYAAESSSSSIELMRIKGNGHVGIGTSNPDKGTLQVAGSFHVENSTGQQSFHVSAEKQLVFVGVDAYDQYQIAKPGFTTSADSPIEDNNFAMWVSKGIVSEDFAIIDPNDWADFVFAENYELNSLEEVAAYIKENGHLPDMPSEAEVKEKGYSLHDINKRLLQKIEELTLYSIQQEDQLKAQKALLKTQQEQFISLEQRIRQLEAKK